MCTWSIKCPMAPGSLVRRQTLFLQVIGDGRMIRDNGRRYLFDRLLFSRAKRVFVTED